MVRQWILARQEGLEASLEFKENVSVPAPNELGRNKGDHGPINTPLIPGCDGAGVVEAVGLDVEQFVPGDRVIMNSAPELAAQATLADTPSMLGHGSPGTLTTIGVFSKKALIHAPKSLDWLPAGSLSCNWPTAWNARCGLKDREVGPGKWVLVQGTGGLSVAILQVAVAAGATVVATTSTEDKAARLCELGASRPVNYRGLSVAILQVAVAAGATVVATTSTEDKAARLCELGASRPVNYLTSHPHIRATIITTITTTITTYFPRLAAHPYATFGFAG
ncbi:Zinc-type alcohol dehydrogenase-like protein [Colletotrichum shisoi]|uniref:Zinc-type alcohol dehydrogenase-like protein n=1 Tax=Colletotrichum shisoi TaxID=2078593 RepID=A0A5Q4BFQ7_9PEZI|nr:Zinc-type alcohol dehydrogenase-like protein [Colletotrichum shisoi]